MQSIVKIISDICIVKGYFSRLRPYLIWVERLSLGALKPEEKVNLAIGMSDVCVRVCADAVRDCYPTIKEEELLERVRERISYGKRRKREV